MRIGVDIRVLIRGETTGIQVYTRELLSRLIEIGHSHKFVLFYNAYRRVPLPRAWRQHKRVDIVSLGIPNKIFDITATFARRPRVDRILGGIDLFFQPHFLRAPLSRDCPRVVVAHDCSFEHDSDWFSWRSRLWHARMRPRSRFYSADHVIAVSESTKQDVVSMYGIDSNNVTMVHSGVDHKSSFDVSGGEEINNFLQLPANFFILFSAADKRKNISGAIAAYERFRNRVSEDARRYISRGLEIESHEASARPIPDLVIAGSNASASDAITDRIMCSPVSDFIHEVGHVPERFKFSLLNRAQALLFPSFFEGFGLPPLESLSVSTPVIASDRGALPEVLGNNVLLVDPWDSDGLSDAMIEIWDDESLRRSLGEGGASFVKKYSWDKTAQETLKVFEGVLSRSS